MAEKNNATKQASKGAGKGGIVPPVERQFGKPNGNPRHNGAWKKEDTARYKLEQMLKLTERELKKLVKDEDASFFERKLAACIASGKWRELEGMMNQAYGQPKQQVETMDITPPKPLFDRGKRATNNSAGKD